MQYHVVTTMNKSGWAETGRRMAESFVKNWEIDNPLTIYAEDFVPDIDGVVTAKLPKWMSEFKEHYGRVPLFNGRLGFNNQKYDYRWDAVKFAHKVAALTEFAGLIDEGIVIWLDADTFTHSKVTETWLNGLFPVPSYLAWLDRTNNHPECGFVMYRAYHPFHQKFMEGFKHLYTSGDIFKLKETHDSYALQHFVMQKVQQRKIPLPTSLSGDRNWHHPFVNGPLGACLDHMKGPRKLEGKSRKRDFRNQRREEYWKGLV